MKKVFILVLAILVSALTSHAGMGIYKTPQSLLGGGGGSPAEGGTGQDNSSSTGLPLWTDGTYSVVPGMDLPVLTAEPSETAGTLYVADCDTWDPNPGVCPGTNDVLVLCTAAGSPGTFVLIRDMVTGELYNSSFTFPNGTDPDLTSAAQVSHDTDGANETSDAALRGYDGINQFAWSRKLKCINATIPTPNDYADALRDKMIIWSNETGMTYTVTKIEAWADTDDSALNVEEYDGDGTSNNATIDAINCTTGSGPYSDTETTITGATVEASHVIALDFDDTDDPGWVKITICGWLNANVD
jgi:hypothetical protein